MQTMKLDELLKWGAALEEAEARRKAEEAEAEAREHKRMIDAVARQAVDDARSLLGPLFDELGIGDEWSVNEFWKPPLVRLKMKFDIRLEICGINVHMSVEGLGKLIFPCSDEALAQFVLRASNLDAQSAMKARAEAERRIEEAVVTIAKGGEYGLDGYRSPEIIYEGVEWRATKYPDLKAMLDYEMSIWQAKELLKKGNEAAAAAHQADVQSKVWFDFTVWELTCTAWTSDEDGRQFVEDRVAYSLNPEPDADGWWPVLKYDGELVNTKFPSLTRIEETRVTGPDTALAKKVCRHVTIGGASVLMPPEEAVVFETEDLSADLDGSRLKTALDAVRKVAEKYE